MSKKFSIKIKEQVFESNEDGFLNLNDIWKGCELPSNKRPSQWRGKIREDLEHYANLHTARVVTASNEHNALFGDELASVTYAMFVSISFHREVVTAFVALRNGELAKAYDIAKETNPLAETAFDKWMSYADTPLRDATAMLGVKRVMLFMSEAKKPKQLASFVKRGILKHRNYGDKGTAVRITSQGKAWLRDNIETVNTKLEEIYNSTSF